MDRCSWGSTIPAVLGSIDPKTENKKIKFYEYIKYGLIPHVWKLVVSD